MAPENSILCHKNNSHFKIYISKIILNKSSCGELLSERWKTSCRFQMSVLCRVWLVFPPLCVLIWFVSCPRWVWLLVDSIQLCFSYCLWLSCVFIVLSVQLVLVWLTRYSLLFLCVCLALPCLALPCLALPCLALPCLVLPCLALPCLALMSTLNTINLSYILVSVFFVHPIVCNVTPKLHGGVKCFMMM